MFNFSNLCWTTRCGSAAILVFDDIYSYQLNQTLKIALKNYCYFLSQPTVSCPRSHICSAVISLKCNFALAKLELVQYSVLNYYKNREHVKGIAGCMVIKHWRHAVRYQFSIHCITVYPISNTLKAKKGPAERDVELLFLV